MGINNKKEKEKKEHLALAQGDTYSLALDEMKEEDVSDAKEIEDYIVSLACEDAEGMYMYNDQGKLEWMIPAPEENIHVEVVVQDKDDKRFLPGLEIDGTLFDEHNKKIVKLQLPFIWHPFLFHYGMNTTIPKEGKYTLEVVIKKPSFHRHDETYGKRYEKDVTVKLGPVKLKPGRKEHGEE
jgi:hypothetical protein